MRCGRGREAVDERRQCSGRLSQSPVVPSRTVVLVLFVPLVLLIAATLWARAAGEATHDLSLYPWVYLRDDQPLGPGEDVAEIIAVGDVMVGRGVTGEPFDEVRSWLHAADLVVGNLESVLAENRAARGHGPGNAAAEFVLHAPASAVVGLKEAGFRILGLANNHALDLGAEGLEETASHLEAVGIAAVGAGLTQEDALRPVFRDVKGVRLAFLALSAVPDARVDRQDVGWVPAKWNQGRATAAVATAKNRAHAVLVSMHWGYEYQTIVDPAQRDAAGALLEAGADLVIGHHPHVVQALEVQGGQVVAYSLGNFVFDQEQGETKHGLVIRALFDDEGLRALQALPVWAGRRPRLMEPEDAASLLVRVVPSPRRIYFACEEGTCRQREVLRPSAERARSGLFWGGEIDLTGDGHPEHVRRVGEQAVIYEDGAEVWRSPSHWRVVDVALGDPNDDGRGELLLALWKRGLDGLEPPDGEKEKALRSRPFIVGYRGGVYRTLWGGSAVAHPIREVELDDVDGDQAEELIVLEGERSRQRTVSVWRWHGWGFSLMWRSSPGSYRDLVVGEDESISVAFE